MTRGYVIAAVLGGLVGAWAGVLAVLIIMNRF